METTADDVHCRVELFIKLLPGHEGSQVPTLVPSSHSSIPPSWELLALSALTSNPNFTPQPNPTPPQPKDTPDERTWRGWLSASLLYPDFSCDASVRSCYEDDREDPGFERFQVNENCMHMLGAERTEWCDYPACVSALMR